MSISTIAGALLLLGSIVAAPGAAAASREIDYRISATVGHDSNPLRVMGDGPDSVFTELRASGSLSQPLRGNVKFFLDGNARNRAFGSAESDADSLHGKLRAGFTFRPSFLGENRLGISTGGEYSLYRATYIDREFGLAYAVADPGNPGSTIGIGDRLDRETESFFADARFKVNSKVRLSLETDFRQTDYIEDYEIAGIDSLDYSQTTYEPGVTVRAGRSVALKVSLVFRNLQYDSRPALDDQGTDVPGVDREYRTRDYAVAVRITPSDGWKLRVGLRGGGRNDVYAGYYDNSSLSTYFSVDRALGAKSKLRFYTSLYEIDYDNATVTGESDGEILGIEVKRFLGRFERKLHERLGFFFESGVQRSDSQDPTYTYDKDWLLTGIRFER